MMNNPSKCSRIRYVVRLRQMVRRWRQKAASRRCGVPSDVPAGHVAVTAGVSGRRFVVRASHLNHPIFRRLLVEAEEEYGFANQWGPLAIPCDDLIFQDILCFLDRPDLHDDCHLTLYESRPLLPPPKSVR